MNDGSAGYKFKPGSVIHESLIHRKYRDVENGEIFVGIFGVDDKIYRVDGSNRFIYDTPFDSSKMPELILMEERRKSFSEPALNNVEEDSGTLDASLRPYLKKAFILKDNYKISVYDENYFYIGEINRTDVDAEDSEQNRKPSSEPVVETPVKELPVEDKSDESVSVYLDPSLKFDFNFDGTVYAMTNDDGFFTLIKKSGEAVFEYYTQDRFAGVDKNGQYLTFVTSNGIMYGKKLDGSMVNNIDGVMAPDNSKEEQKQDVAEEPQTPPPVKLSEAEVTGILMKSIKRSLDKNGIEASLFVKDRLEDQSRLAQVMQGNLGVLNSEIAEAASKGVPVNHKQGYTLLKAALLHELFINTTLGGRGGHRSRIMRQFILELILITPHGKFEKDNSIITRENQIRVLNWLLEFRNSFRDKSEVIEKLIKQLSSDDELVKITRQKDCVNTSMFKALVVSKIYEYTTRLDRGNGLAMIALSRAVMDINRKST